MGLQSGQEGGGFGRLGCGGEDRLLVGLQHGKPGREILRVIRSWLGGDAQIGAEEGGSEFGDQLLHRIGLVTHLAVAFCRCMNIPARYANGFLGDIGVPPDPAPMDYNAWFEVFLDGRWFTFDARHNTPRIGRITVARGRDATDIPLVTSFGPHILKTFRVWTDEVNAAALQNLNRRSA